MPSCPAREKVMPIVFSVDHEIKRVTAIAIGSVKYEDIYIHLMHEKHRRGLSYPELMDARGAGFHLSPSEVQRVVELLKDLASESMLGPTAVLVSNDKAFGLMQALEVLAGDVCQIKTFRDEKQAQEWLDGLV